ncbi:MAG: hypothetical protein OQK32_08870 [Gammaproteobacteria bacterium]|nr:hypothetical protein [Gammaproteobacteria bacterium]MCW8922524.1 hypothetical protein [Gammaproteobacteria bacterium]
MKNKVIDLVTENAEAAFDLLLEDGVLKDIPILGDVVKILRIKGDISNILYAKKLEAFLCSLSESNYEEITLDDKDKEELEKIGLDLVFIIDKINNIDKSKWAAQAVIGLANKKYNLDTFERLIYAIDNFSPTLKDTLDIYYKPVELVNGVGACHVYDGDHPEELANIGLLTRKFESKVSNDGFIPVHYAESNLGMQLWYIIENA